MSEYSVLGKSVPRVDAVEKATGNAKYATDMVRPGMLFGKFVGSQYPHARILNIDTSKAERLPGVKAVVTQADVPTDEKLFATEKVFYSGEPIAAVAAIDPDIAEEAVAMVEIEYEPLPAVFEVMEAIKEDAPKLHSPNAVNGPNGEKFYNIAGEAHPNVGNVEEGFAKSDVIIENTYSVPRVHHCYMEPNVCLAEIDNAGRVTAWVSTQGTFAIRSSIASALGISLKDINVVGATMGGGFGAKFDPIVHPHAVLLAQKSGRPVKLALTRKEEFIFGHPAPGVVIHLKTGAKKDGTVLAQQALAFWDGSSAWSTIKVRNIYKIPNVKVDAYNVLTNKPPVTAYRAPGVPQPTYACESQWHVSENSPPYHNLPAPSALRNPASRDLY
jgi:CO/xanthine dehydrogenase Mo-binding subunit